LYVISLEVEIRKKKKYTNRKPRIRSIYHAPIPVYFLITAKGEKLSVLGDVVYTTAVGLKPVISIKISAIIPYINPNASVTPSTFNGV